MFWTLAQQNNDAAGGIFAMILLLLWLVFILALVIVTLVGGWKLFTKAGRSGWEFLIPIWNLIVMIQIGGRSGWLVLGYFIPIVNIILAIVVANDIAKSFGRGLGTTIGLFLLPGIFIPILGFGSAEYQGPAAA